MGETYNDRHDSKIYGARLIIYRRGDVENASFTFRAKVAGQKGYIRRNTKTDDPARAMVLAEQAYEELQVRKKSGLSLVQLSANAFFDEWVEKQKTKLTATRWNWKRNCWDRYISSYLGHHNLADLTKKFVDGYWDHRTKFWTTAEGQKRILLNDKRVGAKTKSSHNVAVKPSYATLRMEAGLINEVLQGAVDGGHLSRTIRISAQDAVGKSERGDGFRDTFTDEEWTASTLERLGVPFRIIIEPQDWDDYRAFFTSDQLIVAPFSNHGDGPGRARNYAWDIAVKEGHAAHWVMDDNIKDFYRLHKNERLRFGDGGCFRVMEDFFDRFENLYIAGPQYRFFCAPKQGYPQSVLNTRIYSCLLIRNDCKHRWRGRYNEDTDLSLRVLKDGDCTLQWNEFLQEKMATQALTGGNTTEFYHAEHLGEDDPKLGTYNVGGTFQKSAMLKEMHPDETELVCKYGRWHHEVNYDGFKANKLRFKAGMETSDRTYPFELIERHS